ncbi:MAG: creatininase family protein [Candidatus Thorarchaeota archaeon]
MTHPYRLAQLTWKEVETRVNECKIILVPIGSTEQHGPALPLDNDYFIATRFAELICEALWPDVKVTMAPTIAFGYSAHHMDFKGTISLDELTLASVIVDIVKSLSHHGFENIILLNGHGGNETGISLAINRLHEGSIRKVFSIGWWTMISDRIPELFTRPVCHACDMETSVAWALGQRVLEDRRVDEPGRIPYPGFIEPDMLSTSAQIQTGLSMKDYTDSGVIGYSTRASVEKGKKAVELVVNRIVEFINSLI